MSELGKLLQQARKKKKYSLEQIYKLTRISQRYVKALEESDSSVFPAEIYYKSFLKNYAKFLELDLNEVTKLYEWEKNRVQYELFSNDEISGKSTEKQDTTKSIEKKVNNVVNTNNEIKDKKDTKDTDVKKIVSIMPKNSNKKEDVKYAEYTEYTEDSDTRTDIVYAIKNKGTKRSDKSKLFIIVILCILFVVLLLVINIFFKQTKSSQIKEKPEIVYSDDISNDKEKEIEPMSENNVVSDDKEINNMNNETVLPQEDTEINKIKSEEKISTVTVTAKTVPDSNKKKNEVVSVKKDSDNDKKKSVIVPSKKVFDTGKMKTKTESIKTTSNDKQNVEIKAADTVSDAGKEKVETVLAANISDNNKKDSSEKKKSTKKQSLGIKAIKDSLITVFVDGEKTFSGILSAGQKQSYSADNNFTIVMKNAEALKVSFNGKSVDTSVGAKEDKSNTLTLRKEF